MLRTSLLTLSLACMPALAMAQGPAPTSSDTITGISIVGYDPATGEIGVAMASSLLAVGPIAAHVRLDVGAVATMDGAPVRDGQLILDWLEEGASPELVIDRLLARHPQGIGQIHIVDATGRSMSVTGENGSNMWKGHRFGRHFAGGGSRLTGPAAVDALAEAFEATEGSRLPLGERLLRALAEADRADGAVLSQMSATLRVVRRGASSRGIDDYVNLRVDDSPNAINELRNLYVRWQDVYGQEAGARIMEQSRGEDVAWLQKTLMDLGYLDRNDQSIFDAAGEPIGVFNDATAEAVVNFKRDNDVSPGPSVGMEIILLLQRVLENGGAR